MRDHCRPKKNRPKGAKRELSINGLRYMGPVPDSVFIERDFAQRGDARDVTAQLCGDPLRGRSALDRRSKTDHH